MLAVAVVEQDLVVLVIIKALAALEAVGMVMKIIVILPKLEQLILAVAVEVVAILVATK